MNSDFVEFFNNFYRVSKDGSIRNASNRVALPGNVFKEYIAYAVDHNKSQEGVDSNTIAAYFGEMSHTKEKPQAPTLKDIVNAYMAQMSKYWKISPTWSEIEYLSGGPGSVPVCSDIEKMAESIYVWADTKGIKTNKTSVSTYLSVYAAHRSATVVDGLFKDIGYDPAYEEECNVLLGEIHDMLKIRESKEVFYTFMKHWIWQVKRKIMGWEVYWEIWLNFFGASGVGKSRLLRALCQPLSEFYLEAQISVFADATRERDKFTKYYVLNFDELTVGGPSRYLGDTEAVPEDVQRAVKQFTTQKKMTSRTLGGQNQSTRRITFNPISSANEHLYDIMFDPQTMRRFYEFHCDMESKNVNSNYYKHKDEVQSKLLSVWKGVNEKLLEGYWNQDCSVWEETRATQNAYYPTKTTTSLWIDAEHVVSGGESNCLDMYQDYASWCKERGYKARSQRSWLEDVQHIIPNAKESHRAINISFAMGED